MEKSKVTWDEIKTTLFDQSNNPISFKNYTAILINKFYIFLVAIIAKFNLIID